MKLKNLFSKPKEETTKKAVKVLAPVSTHLENGEEEERPTKIAKEAQQILSKFPSRDTPDQEEMRNIRYTRRITRFLIKELDYRLVWEGKTIEMYDKELVVHSTATLDKQWTESFSSTIDIIPQKGIAIVTLYQDGEYVDQKLVAIPEDPYANKAEALEREPLYSLINSIPEGSNSLLRFIADMGFSMTREKDNLVQQLTNTVKYVREDRRSILLSYNSDNTGAPTLAQYTITWDNRGKGADTLQLQRMVPLLSLDWSKSPTLFQKFLEAQAVTSLNKVIEEAELEYSRLHESLNED